MESVTASVNYDTETTTENNTRWTNIATEAETDITLLARSHYYFKASMVVNNYYGPFLVICGLAGNTLSFLVMIQVSEPLVAA